MREIKFRAWDTYDNKMKYKFTIGSITNSDDNLWTCPTIWVEGTGWVNCDTLVLMQYTGLKDKQGVEIYEGDIVKNEVYIEGYKHVEYHNGSFGYKILIDNSFVWYAFCENTYFLSDIEVIGNIHQTPELLEMK